MACSSCNKKKAATRSVKKKVETNTPQQKSSVVEGQLVTVEGKQYRVSSRKK